MTVGIDVLIIEGLVDLTLTEFMSEILNQIKKVENEQWLNMRFKEVKMN